MKITVNLAILLAAGLAVALLADAWRSARHDSQQLAATLAAQNAVVQQADEQEKQRDAQLAATLSSIQSQKRSVQTPEQAARELASVLPTLPLPVSVQIPNLTALPPGQTPPAEVSIPKPDLVPLYDSLQDCRASTAANEVLKKDLADEKERSTSLLQERNAAITAAHGGPLIRRLKRATKWFLIGTATGAILTALTHR